MTPGCSPATPARTATAGASDRTLAMTPELDADFYAALWIGALLLAAGEAIDAFSAELDDLAAQFFARCRPVAKA